MITEINTDTGRVETHIADMTETRAGTAEAETSTDQIANMTAVIVEVAH